MTMLILQTLLLVAIAYILGCILGCLFHQWFGTAPKAAAAAAPVAATAIAASAAPRTVTPPPPPPPPPAPKPAAVSAPAPVPMAAPVVQPAPAPAPVPAPKPAQAPKAKAAPARKKASAPKPAPKPAVRDDLKRIRGIGRQNEARLNAMGVTAFAQIAAWSRKDQSEMGERLAFPGRIEREEWVKQAAVLARGSETAFSKRVAKGEIASSVGKGSVGDLGKKPPTIARARGGKGDNLTLIDGVGNAIEKKLFAMGIHHFDQIAAWTSEHETWVGNELGFPGRPQRENWVKEASILAAGGTTEHAKRVEEGKIGTSRKSKPGENK